MRLTTRTNLAARTLMFCAVNSDRLVRTSDIAEQCNTSQNHAAHVVQQLHAAGFIKTLRGRGGGLRLAKPMDQICIGDVMRVLEQDIPIAECFDPATNTCPLIGNCRLKSYIARALEAFFHELDMVTLADLVQGNCGLQQLLQVMPLSPESCAPRS